MELSRQACTWLKRTLVLLTGAAVIGCASEPVKEAEDRPDEEGRVKLGESSLAQRNFDARPGHNARQRFAAAMASPRLTGRFAALDIIATFDETTGVTRTLMSTNGFLTGPTAGEPRSVAFDFAHKNLELLGLTKADLAGMEVTDFLPPDLSGTAHIYYRQRHLGLPVYNGQLQLNVQKDGRILSINNAFVPNLASVAISTSPAIGADAAVANAAANLSVELGSQPHVLTAFLLSAARKTQVEAPGLSKSIAEAQLMWLPINVKHVALVWNFQIETLNGDHHFDFNVDAGTGKVWTRFDRTAADSYRVYKEPVESPNHSTPARPADGRVVVTNPANPTASPLGWHNNGTDISTRHQGNNVYVYEDRDANDQPPDPDLQPDCGSSFNCDFPINFSDAPTAYTSAIITNIFYWSNLVHDVTFHYGFNEASGNFQAYNFSGTGLGNDSVLVEVQDGSRFNDARFTAFPDGQKSRMEMTAWGRGFVFLRDASLDNLVIAHEYGHGISDRLVGGPANIHCLENAQSGSEGWSDWVGLWFTAKTTDVGLTGRGIATYLEDQPTTGIGWRQQHYSIDPALNTWTYASINGPVEAHIVGQVWAQVLWEIYWILVDQYGYSSNLHDASGDAGNQRAMLYVIQGLKNTACSPTFVDARDGIIAAAVASHNGQDVCRLWSAFAAFGLGTNAVSGGPSSVSPTEGFMIPPSCPCTPQPVADAGPDRSICPGSSVTLGTPARPNTTYSWSPGGATTAQLTVSPTATTTYTVTATTSCGAATDSVPVTVNPPGGGGFLYDFETGTTGWTATGLWHLTNNSACASPGYSSPTRAFYYGRDSGCNYNTGATTSGALTSPQLSGLTASSTLKFNYRRTVESFNSALDRTFVDVIRSNGTVTTVFSLDSRNPSTPAWTASPVISLAAFAGDTIRLRFTFNSVDSAANAFLGWFIDDVQVTTTPPCP